MTIDKPRPVFHTLVVVLGVPLLAALILAVPVGLGVSMSNIDRDTHMRWLVQAAEALRDGIAYSPWLPRSYGGLGELIYPPYPLYWLLGGGLVALGLLPWTAMLTLAAAAVLVSGLVVQWALRRHAVPAWTALVASGAVMTAPLVFFLFSHHAAYPWHFSLCVGLVFVVLSARFDGSWRAAAVLAVVTALMVLAHVLVALLALLSVGAVQAVRLAACWRSGQGTAAAMRWFIAVVLGVAVVAAHLLPAMAGRSLADPTVAQSSHYFDWRNSMTFPVFTGPLHGYRWWSVQWLHPLVILAIAGLVWVGGLRGRDGALVRQGRFALAVVVAALLLSSELAYPLYRYVEPLRAVQWPYRFASMAALAAALALALAVASVPTQRWRQALLTVALALQIALLVLLQAQVVREGSKPQPIEALLQQVFAQSGNEPGVMRLGWRAYVDGGGLAGECRRLAMTCEVTGRNARRLDLSVTSPQPQPLRLPYFGLPVWRVTVDGQPVAAGPDAVAGVLTAVVPAGSSRLQVAFVGVPQERAGAVVSAVALVLLGIVLWLGRRERRAATAPHRLA